MIFKISAGLIILNRVVYLRNQKVVKIDVTLRWISNCLIVSRHYLHTTIHIFDLLDDGITFGAGALIS